MLITARQITALYALRQAAPMFDLDEDGNATRLVVTFPDGSQRLIDQSGTTYRVQTPEEESTR